MKKNTVNTYIGGINRDISNHKKQNNTAYNIENARIVTQDGDSTAAIENVHGNTEMNYDGSLYGDQYFPDAITANQVNVGKLGSTASADGSGQGVLEWDGSRVGPNPDTKASEMISRRGVGWVASIAAIFIGGKLLMDSRKSE